MVASALRALGVFAVVVAFGSWLGASAGAGPVVLPVSLTGAPVGVSLDAGSSESLTFVGSAGDRVTIGVVRSSFGASGSVALVGPDGAVIGRAGLAAGDRFDGPFRLPSAGVFSVLVSSGETSGAGAVSVWLVPADATAIVGAPTLAGAATSALDMGTPGQGGLMVFSGTAGARVSLRVDASTVGYGSLSVSDPVGAAVASGWFSYGRSLVGPFLLGSSGIFSVRLAPALGLAGSVRVVAYAVPADSAAVVSASSAGARSVVSIAAPGEQGSVTFAGAAGDRFAVRVAAASLTSGIVRVVAPGGIEAGRIVLAAGDGFVGPFVATAAGAWSVTVDGTGGTGEVPVDVFTVPADAVASVATQSGAAPVAVVIATPGQAARAVVDATAGDRVAIDLTRSSFGSLGVRVLDPGGAEVLRSACAVGACAVPVFTATTTGAYAVLLDPDTSLTGSVTVSGALVAAPSVTTLAIGEAGDLTLSARGAVANADVVAVAGQRVSVAVTAATFAGVVEVRAPGGSLVASGSLAGASLLVGPFDAALDGVYRISVTAATAGSARLAVANVVDGSVQGVVGPSGAVPVVAIVATPGTVATVSMVAHRLDALQVEVAGSSLADGVVSVIDPSGGTVLTASIGVGDNVVGSFAADSDGTYRVVVSGSGIATGSVGVRVVAVARAAYALALASPIRFQTVADRDVTGMLEMKAGDVVAVALSGSSFAGTARVLDGSSVVAAADIAGGSAFLGPVRAPHDGTYLVVVSPVTGSIAGGALVAASAVPAPADDVVDVDGAAHTVLIAAPGQAINARLHGDAGEQLALTLEGRDGVTGSVALIAPDGTLVSTLGLAPGGQASALLLPVSGWYRLTWSSTTGETGSLVVTATDGGGGVARTLALDDPAVAVAVAPSIASRVIFSAPAGARASIVAAGTDVAGSVSLVNDAGAMVSSTALSGSGVVTTPTLLAGGSYAIVVRATTTGVVRVRAVQSGADVALSLPLDGSEAPASVVKPGQRIAVTLPPGAAGTVSLRIHAPGLVGATITVDDGSASPPPTFLLSGADRAVSVVATSGRPVTVGLDPSGTATGIATFSASAASGSIDPGLGGVVSTFVGTSAGEPAITIAATAGERVALQILDAPGGLAVSLRAPDGTLVATVTTLADGTAWIPGQLIAADGTYRVAVTGALSATRVVTVVAYDASTPKPGPARLGQPAAVSIVGPGQGGALAFAASTGQLVAVRISASTLPLGVVTIRHEDGSVLAETLVSGATGFLGGVRVDRGDQFVVSFEAVGPATGGAAVTVFRVGAPAVHHLLVNGAPASGRITAVGAIARYSVDTRTGERLHLVLSDSSFAAGRIVVSAPDGSIVAGSALSGAVTTVDAGPLAVSGTYFVDVRPADAATGSFALAVAGDQTTALPTGFLALGAGAQTAVISSGATDLPVSMDAGSGIVVVASHVAIAAGGQLALVSSASGVVLTSAFLDPAATRTYLPAVTVPAGGVTIRVTPASGVGGTVALELLDGAASVDTAVVGDGATVVAVDVPGGASRVTVSASAAARSLRFVVSDSTLDSSTFVIRDHTSGVTLATTTLTAATTVVDAAVRAGAAVDVVVDAPVGVAGTLQLVVVDTATIPVVAPAAVPVSVLALTGNAALTAPTPATTMGALVIAPHFDALRNGSFALRGGYNDVTVPASLAAGTRIATSSGPVTITPQLDHGAAPFVVGQSALVYQGTQASTDTIVRPTALGVESFLQLRDADAPASYTWQVAVPAGARLERVSATRVAVIAPAPADDVATPVTPITGDTSVATSLTGAIATVNGQLDTGVREFVAGANATLQQNPPTDTGDGGRRDGTLHPWHVLTMIDAAWARDAAGALVPTTLTIVGSSVVLGVSHHAATTQYPVIVDPLVASDQVFSLFRDYQKLWEDDDPALQVTRNSPSISGCFDTSATGTANYSDCLWVFSYARQVYNDSNAFLQSLPYGYAVNKARVVAFRHAWWQANLESLDSWAVAWAALKDAGAPAPIVTADTQGRSIAAPYWAQFRNGTLTQAAALAQMLGTNTSSATTTITGWAYALGQSALGAVGPVGLGVDPQYTYASGSLAWGASWSVNVATPGDATTTTWATLAPSNVIVRWTPLQASGKGLDTILSVAYNSAEGRPGTSPSPASPDLTPSALGPGWTLAISGLLPLNEGLAVVGSTMSFRDADGTVHVFTRSSAPPVNGVEEWYPTNGEQLSVAHIVPPGGGVAPEASPPTITGVVGGARWEITTRSAVTYDFDATGRPSDVRDASSNTIRFLYDTPTGRVTSVVDQRGRSFLVAYAASTAGTAGYWQVVKVTGHPTFAAGSTSVVASPQPAVEFAFDANGYLSLLGRCTSATACGTTSTPQADHAFVPTYDVNPRAGRSAPQLTSITVPRSAPTTGEATSFVASWPTGPAIPPGTTRIEVTTVDAANTRVSDTTQIDATPAEQQTTVSLVSGAGVVERRTIDDLDGLGRVIRETRLHDSDPTSTAGDRVTSTRWLDDPGRSAATSGFLRANLVTRVVDATGAVTTSTYDPDGMLASVTNDNGATTSYSYAPFELYTTGSGVSFAHACASGTCPTIELPATSTHPNGATDSTLYQGGLLRPAITTVPLPGMVTETDAQYDGTPSAPLVRRTTYTYWDGAATTLADDRFLLHQTIVDPGGLADTTTIDRYDQNGLPYRVNTNAAISNTIHDAQGLTLFSVDALHGWIGGSLVGWQADEGGAVDTLLDDPNLQTGTWTRRDGFGRATVVTTPKWTYWQRGILYQTTTTYLDASAEDATSDPVVVTVANSTSTPVDPFTTPYTPVTATHVTFSLFDGLGRVVSGVHGVGLTADAVRDTHYASTGEVDWVVTAQERTRWLGQVGGSTGPSALSEGMFGIRTSYDFLGEPYRTDHDGYDPSQAASSATHLQLRTTFRCFDGDGRVTITYPPASGLSAATTGTSLDCTPEDVANWVASGYDHAVVSAYDGVGNMVSSYTYWRGAETWDYDSSNNVIEHTDTSGVVEHSAYNLANERYLDAKPIDASSYPTTVSYATTYTTYDAEGHVRDSFDPMASSKTGKAAAAGWMSYAAAVTTLGGSVYATENTWVCGRLDRVKRPSAIGASGTGSEGTRPRQRYVYDPDGRLVKSSPWYVATSDASDDAGAFKSQSCATSAVGSGWVGADATLLTLEDSGAIAADQTPGRNSVVYRYDFPADPSKKTYRAVCSTTGAPSLAGASAACVALGTGEQPETWTYDTRGWVHPVVHHSWASPATTDEAFVTDLAWRVTSASVNALTTGYVYERYTDFGELYDTATRTQFSDAALAWVKTSFTYDQDGNVVVRRDRRYSASAGGVYTAGTTITSTYNPDRTVASVLPSGWGAKQLFYYYTSGRLIQRQMWNASTGAAVDEIDYAYSDNGLVTNQDTYKGNGVPVEQHTFLYMDGSVYSDGSVTQDTYWRAGVSNSGRTISAPLKCTTVSGNCRDIYHYDFLNRRVSQATSWGWETGGATYVPTDETVCYTLLPDGRTSTIYRYKGLGCSGTAAGSTGNTYDAAGVLTKQTITTPRPVDIASPGILVERRFLLHNAAGDVACTRRTMDDATTSAPTSCAAAKPGTLQEWWKESEYSYGPFDRVASQTSYNAPGGVGGSNVDTYTRDALGRVVRDAVVYHQQGDTHAVETAYVGASSTPVTEANDYGVGGTLNLTREVTVGGAGETLSYGYTPNHRTIASGTYLPLSGARGETSVVLDSNDTVMQTYGASPDGAANIVTSDASLNTAQITSALTATHQTDHATISMTRHATADTGSMPPATVLGARVYRSDVGGFVQFDTYHDAEADLSLTLSPANSARSVYAGANPEAFLDPSGHAIPNSDRAVGCGGNGLQCDQNGRPNSGSAVPASLTTTTRFRGSSLDHDAVVFALAQRAIAMGIPASGLCADLPGFCSTNVYGGLRPDLMFCYFGQDRCSVWEVKGPSAHSQFFRNVALDQVQKYFNKLPGFVVTPGRELIKPIGASENWMTIVGCRSVLNAGEGLYIYSACVQNRPVLDPIGRPLGYKEPSASPWGILAVIGGAALAATEWPLEFFPRGGLVPTPTLVTM